MTLTQYIDYNTVECPAYEPCEIKCPYCGAGMTLWSVVGVANNPDRPLCYNCGRDGELMITWKDENGDIPQ